MPLRQMPFRHYRIILMKYHDDVDKNMWEASPSPTNKPHTGGLQPWTLTIYPSNPQNSHIHKLFKVIATASYLMILRNIWFNGIWLNGDLAQYPKAEFLF